MEPDNFIAKSAIVSINTSNIGFETKILLCERNKKTRFIVVVFELWVLVNISVIIVAVVVISDKLLM